MPDNKKTIFEYPMWLITVAYVIHLAIVFAVYWFLNHFWGEYVLMTFSDLEGKGQALSEGLSKVWFIFIWGVIGTVILYSISSSVKRYYVSPSEVFFKGWWVSLNAGVFEELIYRWLMFFIAMVMIPFSNVITFGFVKWMYVEALIPLANWATFGALEPQLLSSNWVLGAAVVSACASFRKAHWGNGIFNWINSWFLGMVFFYLVFNYGIGTAIVAHVLYDGVIFTTIAMIYGLVTPKKPAVGYY